MLIKKHDIGKIHLRENTRVWVKGEQNSGNQVTFNCVVGKIVASNQVFLWFV
jgi:hypothetical protein